ncbi:hypothetical protein [Pseudobacteriovorax antillogorgiicola]|uniref:Uncharacterized protein n=1 Tax=Pseudobacteriovorax antillogorgiicola TaxID=1513793 RepID=A0A1Y6BRY2_9BACT|nr:hypothetical protein [Pseudobacteriovorax antillogorgiicola]TCS54585.1 hypothetical protein EDD56_10698 [Pseudobacteriovorax antillogorgiicola]SMF17819.1 hypothetical protein SAMN06296036_106145 [Pseudobacteriovorax antillogorgiicola]
MLTNSQRQSNRAKLQALSSENTATLGKVFWRLVDEYDLSNKQVATILDVTTAQVSNLSRTRKIPQKAEAYARVGQLLGIKKCLEVQYPVNPKVKSNWLKVKREAFQGASAIDFITEDMFQTGVRLFQVRRLMDLWRVGSIPELI